MKRINKLPRLRKQFSYLEKKKLEKMLKRIKGMLADKGYDSDKFIDYIYENNGEPVIPSRKKCKIPAQV